jgi:hypothetical protein
MTTKRQAETNRRNAALSTGPRSTGGKARVAQNAVKHGAFSTLPVIPGVERPEDWQAHRDGILQSLAPVGALETRLAERVALLLWRLDRVARYETAVTTIALDEAGEEPHQPDAVVAALKADRDPIKVAENELVRDRGYLSDLGVSMECGRRFSELAENETLPYEFVSYLLENAHNELPEDNRCPWIEDDAFFRALGIPEDQISDDMPWTVGLVRKSMQLIAKYGRMKVETLTALAVRGIADRHAELSKRIEETAAKLEVLYEQQSIRVGRKKSRSILPGIEVENRILRYENHLSRQLYQALHELERIRASRDGQIVPVPLAVDVGVSVSDDAADAQDG